MNRSGLKVALLAVSVAALTGWIDWPCINNGFVDWDDYVYLNEVARHQELSLGTIEWAFSTVRPFYYHPLARLSHVLDYRLWGWNPAGHHLTSVFLHGINAGLVVVFIWLLCGTIPALSVGGRTVVAGAVGLVFGIHPLQVESVAWVAERKNLLCACFALISLIAYVESAQQRGGRRWRWVMLVSLIAALLSKPMAVSVPFVMLALDFYPLRRHLNEGWRELFREKVVMIGLCVVASVATLLPSIREGGVTGLTRLGVVARSMVAARSLIFYLWKLVWPRWLSPYYPLEGAIPITDGEYLASATAVLAISFIAIWQRYRAPALLAAWVAYVVLILPVSGLAQTGTQAAGDRFVYLAMLAPLTLAAWLWVWAVGNFRLLGRGALMMAAVCELAFLGYSTRAQIAVWRNNETLWRETLTQFPNSALANYMMAGALTREGDYETALPYAQRAVALSPDFARAHYRLSCVYSHLKRTHEALTALRQAITYDSNYGRLAQRDEDLANLRNDPRTAAEVQRLVQE